MIGIGEIITWIVSGVAASLAVLFLQTHDISKACSVDGHAKLLNGDNIKCEIIKDQNGLK